MPRIDHTHQRLDHTHQRLDHTHQHRHRSPAALKRRRRTAEAPPSGLLWLPWQPPACRGRAGRGPGPGSGRSSCSGPPPPSPVSAGGRSRRGRHGRFPRQPTHRRAPPGKQPGKEMVQINTKRVCSSSSLQYSPGGLWSYIQELAIGSPQRRSYCPP